MTSITQSAERVRSSRAGIILLGVGLFVLPILARQAALAPSLTSLPLTYLPLAIAVGLTLVGFYLWPARTLTLFVLLMMFVDTIQLAAGAEIKLADEIVVPLLALMTLVTRRHVILSRVNIVREAAVIGLVVAAVASSLASREAVGTWMPGLVLLGKGLAVFYIALCLDVRPADVRWVTRLVLGTGIVVLVLGGVELVAPRAFTLIGLVPSAARAGLPAIKSIFYHPQLFGWFCCFVALYLFAHHVVLRRPWMAILALLFSFGVILSARRRAMLGLAVGLGLGFVVDVTRERTGVVGRAVRWVPSAAGTILLLVAFLPAIAGLYQLTIDRYVDPSKQLVGLPAGGGVTADGEEIPAEAEDAPARVALYVGSVAIARDYFPLGAGLGRFGSWISREQYSDLYHQYGLDRVHGLRENNPRFVTDTFWPQILGETGVIGTIGYVTFLGVVGFQLWRVTRRRLPPELAAIALGTVMIFGQTLAESIASPIFNSPSEVYLIMLAIGGTLNLAAIAAARPPPEPEPAELTS
jgi:hypothetical protein